MQSFEFVAFTDQASELTAAVQHAGSFSIPAVCKVEAAGDWEGKTHSIPIRFEPEAIGEVRDVLVLQSDTVGEYKCALHGVATPPLPQGPFVFAGSIDLEFKNVFSVPMEFDVITDSPLIILAAKTLSIPAKTAKTISVKVDAAAMASGSSKPTLGALTAKLFVSCPSMKELPPWVFYLEAQAAEYVH
jgi:hydrocephalus-inducing protein